MKKMLTGLILGGVAGIIIAVAVIYLSAPSMMFKENKSKHDFETSVAELEKSIESHGWKVPHVNDLQQTMKKFGKDVRKVKVYEVCHPDHAYKILNQDDERIVSSLMPCRIAVYEKSDGSVYYSVLNAGLMSKPMNRLIRNTMSDAAAETDLILRPLVVSK